MENTQPKYKRILLKLSGEALSAGDGILSFDFIREVGAVIRKCLDSGVQIGVIVGAGNIWRGRQGEDMNRVRADQMGMLATVINSLALQDAFVRIGIPTRVMTAIDIKGVADSFSASGAIRLLEEGNVVIFGGGTGSPYFSTDTAAVLRAAEIEADAVLMAKNIDGIYSADPKKCPDAVKYDSITYKEVLDKELKALDLSATTFCMENDIRVYAFGLKDPENIYRAVMGEQVGTEIHK
jgi:uridylate kinase